RARSGAAIARSAPERVVRCVQGTTTFVRLRRGETLQQQQQQGPSSSTSSSRRRRRRSTPAASEMAVDDPTATVIDLSSTADATTTIGGGIKNNPSPTMAGSTTSLPAQVDQAASAPAAATFAAAADLDNTCKPTEPKMLKPEHPLQNSEYTFEPIDSHDYKFRLAEIKKEEANRLYSAKQYKQALVVYNEVIDRHSNASDAEKKEQEKKFKEVGEAYGILSDPKKRSRYDNGHDLEDTDFNFQEERRNSRFPCAKYRKK
ncbi:unnamed protein product, partial [Trichogramma brassicae]